MAYRTLFGEAPSETLRQPAARSKPLAQSSLFALADLDALTCVQNRWRRLNLLALRQVCLRLQRADELLAIGRQAVGETERGIDAYFGGVG